MYSILFKIDNEIILEENKELNNPTAEVFVLAVKVRDIISSYLGDFPFKDLSQEDIEGYASYLKQNVDLSRISKSELSDGDLEFISNINIHGLFSLNNLLEEIMCEHGLDFSDYNQANVYMNGGNMQISVCFEVFHHNKKFILNVDRMTCPKFSDLSKNEIEDMKIDEIINYISEYLIEVKNNGYIYSDSSLKKLKTNILIWIGNNIYYKEFILDYMNSYLENLKNNSK